MSIEHWLAFAAASAILLAIPRPTVLLVVSYGQPEVQRAVNRAGGSLLIGAGTLTALWQRAPS
jgi:threonine/homoserine/homoserine lactone efflux protein